MKWVRLYIYVIILLVITALLYGGILPNMVSSQDTITAIIGAICAVTWPVLLGLFSFKLFRKYTKNA